jgi:hypothetical protein
MLPGSASAFVCSLVCVWDVRVCGTVSHSEMASADGYAGIGGSEDNEVALWSLCVCVCVWERELLDVLECQPWAHNNKLGRFWEP